MEDEVDEVKAKRDRAVRVLENLKSITERRLQSPVLTDNERNLLGISQEPLVWAFEELDKHFIAPQAETSPTLAAYGYRMLEILMLCAVSESTFGSIIDNATRQRSEHRSRSSNGGKRNGESRKKKQAEWADGALPVAKQYINRHTDYKQNQLAIYIQSKIHGAPRSTRAIKTVIKDWLDLGLIPKPNN